MTGLLILPAVAVLPGRVDGQLAFVLYREPKGWTIHILLWLVIGLFLTCRQPRLHTFVRTWQRPPMMLLAAWIALAGTSHRWGTVTGNFIYEIHQYLGLFALLSVLLVWQEEQPRLREWLINGLISAGAILTAVGYLQQMVPTPWLPAIDAELGFGVTFPSLMGYKNPMALALLGQLFLVAARLHRAAPGSRWLWALLLASELVYLARLESRSSYLGLVVGVAVAASASAARRLGRRSTTTSPKTAGATSSRRIAAAIAVCCIFAGAVLGFSAPRAKLASMWGFITHPQSFLHSDRGAYLVNTLNMVHHHPFGVGLGDWQTQYPVYRSAQRDTYFDLTTQVRRAHSDHLQVLGETGWLGLCLWFASLGAMILSPWRRSLRADAARLDLWAAAQVAAVSAAMATDYVQDMPYHRFQLFVLFAIALGRVEPDTLTTTTEAAATHPTSRSRWSRVVLGAVLVITSVQAAHLWDLAQRMVASAEMSSRYRQTIRHAQDAADGVRVPTRHLQRIIELGLEVDRRWAPHKTLHKDYLVLAHAAQLAGQTELARAATCRALEHAPYYPNALKLMAEVAGDDHRARLWRRAYRHVMDEATSGFELLYPSCDEDMASSSVGLATTAGSGDDPVP